MSRLEGISTAELRHYLSVVEGRTPTLRLVVGINYKEGVTQTELADWYGISRTTVHNWLSRLEQLEHHPPEIVLTDAPRSGRPSALSTAERQQLRNVMADPPTEHGFEADAWTAPILQRFIEEEFGVEYSHGHVRWLIRRMKDETGG